MSPKSSQPLIWMSVCLLTVGLYASALRWIKIAVPIPPREKDEIYSLDFDIIQPAPPSPTQETPKPEPIPPEPEPAPIPPEPEPEPTPPPPPEKKPPPLPPPKTQTPPPPPKPKKDPALLKRQQEERAKKAARERELKRQRSLAKKRAEEKRRRAQAAKRAAAAKKAAAAKQARDAKRIAKKPTKISGRKPSYPRSARRAGHQGTVIVTFTVGTSGRVTSARITKSSGHRSLDSSALSTVKKWKYKPARNGLGKAVPFSYALPIPFTLR